MNRETLTCEGCGAKGQIEARTDASFNQQKEVWVAKHAPHTAVEADTEAKTETVEDAPVRKPRAKKTED